MKEVAPPPGQDISVCPHWPWSLQTRSAGLEGVAWGRGRGSSQVGGRLARAPPRRGGPAPPVSWPGRPPRSAPTLPRRRRGGRRGGSAGGAERAQRRAQPPVSCGTRAPEDPSPLRPLPTAHLVSGKVTGKSAASRTPEQVLPRPGCQAPHRLGASGSPCPRGRHHG